MPLINNPTIVFVLCFVILVIAPVWLFSFIELGFMMKMMFTIAGGIGIYWGVVHGSMRARS